MLQKRLLQALADTGLNPAAVNTAWVQGIWSELETEWVRKFCESVKNKEYQLPHIQALANAPLRAREALYQEFRRQHKLQALLTADGPFPKLSELDGFDAALAGHVEKFFKRCYDFLGTTGAAWRGYQLKPALLISKRSYTEDFCKTNPTKVVCPYCDCDIGTPELDHYYAKSLFPLLSCSPWNLVPICMSCNTLVTGKGDKPAFAPGPPISTSNWLHPFFLPATAQVSIRLNGTPQNLIARLHSASTPEQVRVNNHTAMIPSLTPRWGNIASNYFDGLVRKVEARTSADESVDFLVSKWMADLVTERGKEGSTMAKTAVCHAVLNRTPGFYEEFGDSNPPLLA